MPDGHRARLAKRVNVLSRTLDGLSRSSELKQLILLFRRPGWTTPAEFLFAIGAVDSLITQAKAIAQLKTGLLRASRAVSTKG